MGEHFLIKIDDSEFVIEIKSIFDKELPLPIHYNCRCLVGPILSVEEGRRNK